MESGGGPQVDRQMMCAEVEGDMSGKGWSGADRS